MSIIQAGYDASFANFVSLVAYDDSRLSENQPLVGSNRFLNSVSAS